MAYALLPDLDQELVDFLKVHASLSPLHGGRVGTSLQSDLTSVRIASLGGTQPWPWQGTSELQIECWGSKTGAGQGQANTLARTVIAAIYDMRGPVDGGYVIGVAVTLRPLWSPDETTARARYIVQVALTATPA
jgi:hypothetical protein